MDCKRTTPAQRGMRRVERNMRKYDKLFLFSDTNQFVCLEYFSTRSDGYIDHFLVFLQVVESFAHITMEIVPRQQIL